MADEISQVVELEVRGITMAVKGGVEAASLVMRMIKAIFGWASEHKTNKAGEKSMKQIFDLCKDGPPQVIDIPKEYRDKILEIAMKQGLRYSSIPDLNPNDNMLPICVPPQDYEMFKAIVKTFISKDITEAEKLIKEKNEAIAKEKDNLLVADPETRQEILVKIENLEQAKQELKDFLDSSKKALDNSTPMTFIDYLMTGVGTEFGKDPEKAIAELEKGVEIGYSFSAKDCLQPIRDAKLMPSSKQTFYVPEVGITIERQFNLDEKSGIVYSEYFVKDAKGEILSFSDRNITKDDWNNLVLPKLLESTNILEDTQVRTFDTRIKFDTYLKYHNNVTLKSEETVLKNSFTKGFSNEEVMREAEHANSNFLKGLAAALRERGKVEISVPQNDLIQRNGEISYTNPDGDTFYFSNVSNGRLKDGMLYFSVEKDMEVRKENSKGQFRMNAVDAKKQIDEAFIVTAELSQSRGR